MNGPTLAGIPRSTIHSLRKRGQESFQSIDTFVQCYGVCNRRKNHWSDPKKLRAGDAARW